MSCVGRAAARRNALKQPRAIRAGPHKGGKKIGLNTGGSSVLFHDTGGLSGIFRGLSGIFRGVSGISEINPRNVKVKSDKPPVQ